MADNDEAATKQRIITHMNADHQDSLQIFLEHYCKVPSYLASDAQVDDISLSYLIIRSKAGRNMVPLEPPMESYAHVRERMVEMDHAAYKGLDRSEITVTEYRLPKTLPEYAALVAALLFVYTISSRRNFENGSILHTFEKGRQPANTRIGPKRIHLVRTRGGNTKYRGLRLESGNFSWGSEGVARKTRIIVVSFHPSNNELIRTNTLTRSAVVQIDAAPFRQWYEAHYGQALGRRRQQKGAEKDEDKKKSKSVEKKQSERLSEMGKVEVGLERQFEAGRLYAVVSSRPGQSGRCDGYVLEGEELAFYQRAIRK
ncbi:MAG: hypothetical protein Q9160_004797 [Pyrenula sp. 1 TL-2023]